jgi:hypothetical protein
MKRDESTPASHRTPGDNGEVEEVEKQEAAVSRQEAVDRLLDKLQTQLLTDMTVKGTVADYLRLLQVRREFADERPKEIEITWVNSLGREDVDEE